MTLAACITAIETMWTANWARSEPVRWHQNTRDTIPAAATYPHWVQIAVEFADDGIVAFGGGRLNNERRLRGSVVIRAFAERGRGEDTQLAVLDAALTVFRGRRTGALSFIGTNVMPEPGASADGNWWVRSGIAVFEYRFLG
jgi:hypothetical protein